MVADFTLWIDDDGCPRDVKEIVLKAGPKRQVPVVLVANRERRVPRHPLIRSVVVPPGLDVADEHIAQHADPGDLVITNDIPLAAILVDKGVQALSHRGELYTKANVGERLAMRDFMTEARASGMVQGGGPPPFDRRAKRTFANAFDRWLTKALQRP